MRGLYYMTGLLLGVLIGWACWWTPVPTSCARDIDGGYSLLSFHATPGGSETDCHYVKRGVR